MQTTEIAMHDRSHRTFLETALEGPDGCLGLTINITDVLAAITGFQGLDYPFEPTADDPCKSICMSVLP